MGGVQNKWVSYQKDEVKSGVSHLEVTRLLIRHEVRMELGVHRVRQSVQFMDTCVSPMTVRYLGWLVYPLRERALHEHDGAVTSGVISSDGQCLFTASLDSTVICWDLVRCALVRRWKAHSRQVTCLALRRSRLVSGSSDCTLRIWDVKRNCLLRTLHGHSARIRGVSFDRSGELIVSGSQDCTLRVWSVFHDCCLRTIRCGDKSSGMLRSFNSIVMNPGFDGSIQVWNSQDERESRTVKISSNQPSILDLAVSCDDSSVVCVTFTEIILLDWPLMKEVRRWREYGALCAQFQPDQPRHMAVGFQSGRVKVMDVSSLRTLREMHCHSDRVHSLLFTPNGTRLVSCSADHSARIWDVSRLLFRLDV